MSTWTNREQAALDALVAKRAAWVEEVTPPLATLAERMTRVVGLANNVQAKGSLELFLRTNADSIRDTLKPFDSGVREGGPDATA